MIAKVIITLILLGILVGLGLFVTNANAPQDLPQKAEETLPKLAIIIDDLGNDILIDSEITKIRENLTLAILPFGQDTLSAFEYFQNRDYEMILHLPMEPFEENESEEKMITGEMDRAEMESFLESSLEAVRGVSGINNHKGSLITSDKDSITLLLKELKKRNLFFVDSFTDPASVAFETAKELGVRTERNDIFLDDSDEKKEIRKQLYKAIELAEKDGSAITIGHSRENTLEVLMEEIPKIKGRVELVFVSELLV